MQNVEKWPNIFWKSFSVHAARFLKYLWSFFNIMQVRIGNNIVDCDYNLHMFLISKQILLWMFWWFSENSYPASIYLFKVSNKNTRKKLWNMFKVNNKNTSTTSVTSFRFFYCLFWIYFTRFSSIFYFWLWTSKYYLSSYYKNFVISINFVILRKKDVSNIDKLNYHQTYLVTLKSYSYVGAKICKSFSFSKSNYFSLDLWTNIN